MLPPEVLRIVLLIGLAATAYMMILAWNDDVQAAKQPTSYSAAPLTSQGEGAVPGSADVGIDRPQVELGTSIPGDSQGTAQVSDVPDNALLVSGNTPGNAAPANPQSNAASGRLALVTTPTLKVWIDLAGGDIVRVQLPKFPVELDTPDVPYQLLENSVSRTYVAQSGLLGDGPEGQGHRPQYQTTTPELEIGEGQTKTLVLEADTPAGVVTKTYTFRGDEYLVDLAFTLNNNSNATKQAGLYAQIKRDSRPAGTDESFALAPQPYLGAALTTPEERYLKVDFDDIDDDGAFKATVEGGWIAFLQHYFLSAWIADPEQTNQYFAQHQGGGIYRFGYVAAAQAIAPGQSHTWNAQFYAGPKDQKRLEDISPNLNLTVDYGFLWWVAVPLFYLLDLLHDLVDNWGVAIILLTVVVKTILYPLSAAGYKSMANMRRVAPAMKRLQERYGNDREKLSKEMMALYKKEGANPLGGCLPMLLPMPIFIALYWVLFESVELRQAPFFLWIEDLAVMDPFFILPLAMGASMYWMQSLSPQMGDPMQQKMMKMMPVMFTVLFLFFPAGLVLYWLVNNVLSVAQQQFVYKQIDRAHAAKS